MKDRTITITIDTRRLKEIHARLRICQRARELWRDAKELWQEHKPPIRIEVVEDKGRG